MFPFEPDVPWSLQSLTDIITFKFECRLGINHFLSLEGEPEAEVHVTVTHLHQKKKRCCFNLFLILLAMLVLAAGVISLKQNHSLN
jgi:hypothetical protein